MPRIRWKVRALWATLRNNWPWKVAAFAVALVVFLTIRQSTSHTQTLTLPVELELEEGATAVPSVEPGVVDITLRGSEEAIRQLSVPGAERPRVRVRPEQPQDGSKTVTFSLSRSDVTCPTGLRVAVARSRAGQGRVAGDVPGGREVCPPLAEAGACSVPDLPPMPETGRAFPSLRSWRHEAERHYVARVRALCGDDARAAARMAGVSRGHWYELLKKYGF